MNCIFKLKITGFWRKITVYDITLVPKWAFGYQNVHKWEKAKVEILEDERDCPAIETQHSTSINLKWIGGQNWRTKDFLVMPLTRRLPRWRFHHHIRKLKWLRISYQEFLPKMNTYDLLISYVKDISQWWSECPVLGSSKNVGNKFQISIANRDL